MALLTYLNICRIGTNELILFPFKLIANLQSACGNETRLYAKMHARQWHAAPCEITRGSPQHYWTTFQVRKGDILARVKLSSRDLAVLELWGPRKSRYDKPTNFGDKTKNKSIPYYKNAHVQGQVRNPTTAKFTVKTSMSTHTHSHT